MEISRDMISFYLRKITSVYFGKHDIPPDDLSGYLDFVSDMRKHAERKGDLDYLRLGFEHVLANPNIDTVELAATDYPFDDAEVREIIHYAWKTIWPDAAPIPPGGPPGVKIVPMSLDDWWAHTGHRPKA
jgi:hypothetical protein